MGQGGRPGLEAFLDLERFLAAAAGDHLGLGDIERESERRGRDVVRLAVPSHLDTRGPGDVGPAILADGTHGPVRLAYQKRHTRSILTLFGEVTFGRVGYGAAGQSSIHPLDAELGLAAPTYRYEDQRRLLRAAVCGSTRPCPSWPR